MNDDALIKVAIQRAIPKAIKKSVEQAFENLRRKIKQVEIIDKAIEDVIPRQYSGYARGRMKSRIRENLRKGH